jgi:hypothetical protein
VDIALRPRIEPGEYLLSDFEVFVLETTAGTREDCGGSGGNLPADGILFIESVGETITGQVKAADFGLLVDHPTDFPFTAPTCVR